jgi:hypothetical protein
MKNSEHPTEKQLSRYVANELSSAESRIVGRHLLQCELCRAAMPQPTVEQFWAAMMTENEIENEVLPARKSALFNRFSLSTIFPVFPNSSSLVWGASAFVLLLGLASIIWLPSVNHSKVSDESASTATAIEKPLTIQAQNSEDSSPTAQKPPGTVDNSANKNSVQKLQATNAATITANPKPALDAKEEKQESASIADRELAALLRETPETIVSLRADDELILRNGGDSNAPQSFALTTPVSQTVMEVQPEFRWEKVAEAKSYQISIVDSQFNEVVTATVTENRFKPSKALQRGEKYLWRVAADTDKGEIIAPKPPQPPVMFRVAADKAESRIEELKKGGRDKLKLVAYLVKEGMLDSAAQTLREILAENPRSKKAQRLLIQIETWQKESQDLIQRCASPAPTATKAAQ